MYSTTQCLVVQKRQPLYNIAERYGPRCSNDVGNDESESLYMIKSYAHPHWIHFTYIMTVPVKAQFKYTFPTVFAWPQRECPLFTKLEGSLFPDPVPCRNRGKIIKILICFWLLIGGFCCNTGITPENYPIKEVFISGNYHPVNIIL